MERLTLDESRVSELRAELAQTDQAHEKPMPGTRLQNDDDVMWFGMFPMRVVWGNENTTVFMGYCPDWFGDTVWPVEGTYITDRAPKDPHDQPAMPIVESSEPPPGQQQQGQDDDKQRQAGGANQTAKLNPGAANKALKSILDQLPDELAKRARAHVKKNRPELLRGE